MGEDLGVKGGEDGAAFELVVGAPRRYLAILERWKGELIIGAEESAMRCKLVVGWQMKDYER